MNRRIYMDYAATTPTDINVLEAMRPYFFETFGNAASPHFFGQEASRALESSRDMIARLIGAKSDEVILTSSATEAANHVLLGILQKYFSQKGHILISAIEHSAVRGPAEVLSRMGFDLTFCPVDSHGCVDVDQLNSLVRHDTRLVAVMHANNEIGTIQPVAEIGRRIRAKNILFLVDAVQTIGQIPVNVSEIGADYLLMSAHKFYGPKGVGALYIRSGRDLPSFIYGGGQEKGRRASTVNVPGAVGMAKALELCQAAMPDEIRRLTDLRNSLIKKILSGLEGVSLNGHPEHRLPKNVHLSIAGVSGEKLLMALDMAGVAASQGSACSVGEIQRSHVLEAIGLSDEQIEGALRLSIGRWTTQQDTDETAEIVIQTVKRLRR